MKFFLDNWWLVALAVVSGGMLLIPMLRGGAQKGLGSTQAVQMMNREKAVVVDLRETAEFASGHIVGAKNIPLATLETKLASSVKNKNLPLILVCKSGVQAARAVAVAQKLGYQKAQSLAGGVTAWREANLPLEKTA